jgi:CBS domain-containing protein
LNSWQIRGTPVVKLCDIMTREVFTASPDTPVTEVAKAMVKGRFGSAIVMQGPVLLGIFTERDVLRAAASGADPAASRISRWMTKDPVTAAPGMDSEEAAQLMLSQGFRHLPIVDEERLKGIVSLRDLLSARIRRAP